MIRTTGSKEKYIPLQTLSAEDNIYIVRWDYSEISNSNLAVWAVEYFYHKPTESELRKIFTSYYNDITDYEILTGFIWNDIPIWLSSENQSNYKAAYDLAIQQNGATLPVTFKFGTELQPVYQVFNTIDELESFYLPAVAYVQECLAEGWRKKDAIDYSLYKINS